MASLRRDGARFQKQSSGFGIDGDGGEAGEKAVSEKAGFALKDWLFVKAGWDIRKFVRADLDARFGLGNRKFG